MTYRTIVTTTINPPTRALERFATMEGWDLIVVADLKTPEESYKSLNCRYLSPQAQEKSYPKLSKMIGWNSIQRRNIGFLEAYRLGAEIIATVDDDNVPNERWGKSIYVNTTSDTHIYEPKNIDVFDPLSVTNENRLWHRGFPLDCLEKKNDLNYRGVMKRKVLVQADLWDGDPDIDAVARITLRPNVSLQAPHFPYSSTVVSPFNSQNTFLSREVLPYYSVLPNTGRYDDIWGGYVLQFLFPNAVIYGEPTVFQERNKQDLKKNLADEVLGYRQTLGLLDLWKTTLNLRNPIPLGLSLETTAFYAAYLEEFRKISG